MSDPEIVRLAERLAGHAMLLLGAGLFSAFLALLAILLVVRNRSRREAHRVVRGDQLQSSLSRRPLRQGCRG